MPGKIAVFDNTTAFSPRVPGTNLHQGFHSPVNNHLGASTGQPNDEEFCCPCHSFRGWKRNHPANQRRSKSYDNLSYYASKQAYEWDSPTSPSPRTQTKPVQAPPRTSALESLPVEILDQIISELALDAPPTDLGPRNEDLRSCLLTSRTMHAVTLSVLYRNVQVPHSVIFSKFLRHITQYPSLGTIVRRLDFSHFTSIGFGRTSLMNKEIQNLTSQTLLAAFRMMPNLKELLLSGHLESDLDEAVLRHIFGGGFPQLRAVDFCGCSSLDFSKTLENVLAGPHALDHPLYSLKRVSFHECSTMSSATFEALLPRLPYATQLDFAHTKVTEKALASLPASASLTHLNLGKCTRLSGPFVVRFLTQHPAATGNLVYLNLISDVSRYRLLSSEDVSALLPRLPTTLRALHLGGAKVGSQHIPSLVALSRHLEELNIAHADVTMEDVNALFLPSKTDAAISQSSSSDSSSPMDCSTPRSWSISSADSGYYYAPSVPCASNLHFIDLSSIVSITQASLYSNACLLTSPHSAPLEVIELGDRVITSLKERVRSNERMGWKVVELGRRGWYVRKWMGGPNAPVPAKASGGFVDDGVRSWKMGARWWGLRKVSVTWGEVGGLQNYYMYKVR